ncbi:MacS family sensor histidine kinase [Nonomuraea sp. KM90]|uniref:MacS family sensor histidine kinase n=1 Tax=Nonomuraea sp. KM90 TaxID=3457428 RepID=UPI003FCCA769
MAIEGPFWRAIAVFRAASLLYAAVLMAQHGGYEQPVLGWLVIGVMALWTAGATFAYSAEALRRWPLLALDLLVTMACLLASPYVEGAQQGAAGTMPVPATWVAGPVLAWAVHGGRRAGALAAAVVAAGDLWLRLRTDEVPILVNGAVLLFLSGVVVGHVAQLARRAEERMQRAAEREQRAAEMEAAQRERERLARDLHDSVLQVLALVQRRGRQIGGEAAELGRLAGEQEAALRDLVAAGPPPPRGTTDLRTLLTRYGSPYASPDGSPEVTVATPATPLVLPTEKAQGAAAAVGAALDNVRAHCGAGARAWVLAESADGTVTVTVRDDGPGIPPGRLEAAAAAGRMGVTRSIRGRVSELGGTVSIVSTPGQGTEVEITLPA